MADLILSLFMPKVLLSLAIIFFFQAEDGIRDYKVTGVQTCALPISLGLRVAKEATVRDQGVRAALLPIGRSEIELLEPIDAAGGVAKFLERRGEGLHHVCFETPDVAAELGAARG